MKKKDLKKISKYISIQLENNRVRKYKSDRTHKVKEAAYTEEGGYQWCEYDSDVSNKFKKLVYNVLKYPSNLNIDINDSFIGISVEDIKYIKTNPNVNRTNNINNSLTKKSNEENYLRIDINKIGFVLNYGYRKQARYKDENILTDLIVSVKEKVKELNANNFNEIWDNVAKESGLIRDANLEDIFCGEEKDKS